MERIERASGMRPSGGLSIARQQSFATPDILRDQGLAYCCDWVNDELPWRFVNGLINLPLNHELSDRQIVTVQQKERRQLGGKHGRCLRLARARSGGERGWADAADPPHALYHGPALVASPRWKGCLLIWRSVRRHGSRAGTRSSRHGETQNVKALNPRTGEADYDFAETSPCRYRREAARLRGMQPGWEALGPEGRAGVLLRFADTMEAAAGSIAAALAIDTGRRAIAAIEVQGCIANIRRWAARGPELFRRP